MGNKIDYRQNSKENKKKIKMIVIIIIIIFVIYLIIQGIIRVYRSLPQTNNKDNGVKYNVKDYTGIEELLKSYNCTYIRTEKSTDVIKVYLTFDKDLYTGTVSNKNYFMSVAEAIVQFENYLNLELIDESRDIDISIICEDTNIVEFKINGDVNYYLNQDSKLNSRKSQTKVTSFTIQSQELQSLIDNNWSDLNINFGTKESTCNDYEIYFDEGIEYKKVSRQVFNLIFTTKYEGMIAGGLNANSTKEEIVEALGDPTFKYSESEYGYLGDNNYLFFDFVNNQVSIYPVQSINSEDENKFISIINEMNSSLDIKAFANKLTDLWNDYDEYDYDSEHVDLKYTLKGIELSLYNNSLENGIYIYQNYVGDRSIQNLDNVYIKDEDYVWKLEKDRMNLKSLDTIEQGENIEENMKEYGIEFAVRFKGKLSSNETGYKGVEFYCRNKEYPDSELSKTLVISSYKWYNDFIFIYSVDNDGIYAYNCRTRANVNILKLEESIKINSAAEGQIIYNNDKVLNIIVK